MKRAVIAGNWKMHKTIGEACALVDALLAHNACTAPEITVIVAPPFTALAAVAARLRGRSEIALCAQTMHWADSGPYTGEISAPMLVELGCSHILIGHSERRADAAETDATVNLKIKSALAHGLVPIVALGETLLEHEAGLAAERVRAQARAAFDGVPAFAIARCIVAYEPIWAIGTGLSEDPANANTVMQTIRETLSALSHAPILYGGSVKASNVAALLGQPQIDGALVGGASLEAESFGALLANARNTIVAG